MGHNVTNTYNVYKQPMAIEKSNTGGHISSLHIYIYINLIQNSQAVKKVCGPQKGYGEKRCEIQGGGQEMAVMVG